VKQLEDNYSQILSLLDSRPRSDDAGARGADAVGCVNVGIQTPVDSVRITEGNVGRLSMSELETSISIYRKLSAENFPYVLLPHDCTASVLAQQRPMLAQAIGVVTSWKTPSIQSARKNHFLRNLSETYFVKYERSLDLLQALLVYFGWWAHL